MRDKVLFSFLSFLYSAVAEHLTDHLGKIIRNIFMLMLHLKNIKFLQQILNVPKTMVFFMMQNNATYIMSVLIKNVSCSQPFPKKKKIFERDRDKFQLQQNYVRMDYSSIVKILIRKNVITPSTQIVGHENTFVSNIIRIKESIPEK